MFRRPRDTQPDDVMSELGRILKPIIAFPWGTIAICYLGVPIVIGIRLSSQSYHIVVRDHDFEAAKHKLCDAGYTPAIPDHSPAPEVLASLPNPQAVMDQVNESLARLDAACQTFHFPSKKAAPLLLVPNSFARLPIGDNHSSELSPASAQKLWTSEYNVYDNLRYPLERALVQSFVTCILTEETVDEWSRWAGSLGTWIAHMSGYLALGNDILDTCENQSVYDWYSRKHGREREKRHGPVDRRIAKRIGSSKEMPVDMSGRPLE